MPEPERQSGSVPGLRALALFVLAVLVGVFVLPSIFPAASALVGKPAPDFALDVVHGGSSGDRVHLAELKGHPVVLDFWASWCDACRVEAPLLDALYRRHRARGLLVIGVATNDQPGSASRFAAKYDLSYPIVHDAGDRVSGLYGVNALPTLVLINADGNVTFVRSGFESERELERLVAPLL
jgi:cytochrome c biogenesis protein CcmG, thiol:disulfide interchange protein DsbE